jgi:hypothetical protein
MNDEKRERRGFGFLRQFHGVWWARYRVGGEEKWENLKTTSTKVAEKRVARDRGPRRSWRAHAC